MAQHHVDHMKEHLARARQGFIAIEDAGSVFLGADEGEMFQELVGFRLQGMQTPLLAAVRFQSHGLPGVPYGRESLASYLASPPRSPVSGPFAAPQGRLVALMPRAHESIPDFLRGLRAGRMVPSMVLDPRRVRLAFDFRAHNPSALEAVKRRSGPLRTYAVRTVDGHVVTGRSSAIRRNGDHRFVALAGAVQHTPRGPVRIPNVMINASWVSLWMDVTEETTRLAAANWVPFLASEACPDPILGLPLGGRPRKSGAATAAGASREAARPRPA